MNQHFSLKGIKVLQTVLKSKSHTCYILSPWKELDLFSTTHFFFFEGPFTKHYLTSFYEQMFVFFTIELTFVVLDFTL